jgi:hypothetical protein
VTDFSAVLSYSEQTQRAKERRARLWGVPAKWRPERQPDYPVIEGGIEWRLCERAPLYAVSSEGAIRRIANGYLAKVVLDRYGARVSLQVGKTSKTFRLSTLVAEAFIGPRPGHRPVHYRDGDRTNARASNLYYASKAHTRSGQGNNRAKLTDTQVREIRALQGVPQTDLQERYGISKSQVWKIINGQSRRGTL